MFSRIRKRLTLLYAALLAFFLITFVSVCFLAVTYVTTYELDQGIRLLAREEAEEQLEFYKNRGKLGGTSEEVNESDHDTDGLMFYYVFDTQGNLMNNEEPAAAIRHLVLESIRNGHLAEGETERFTYKMSEGQDAMIIMTARSINDGEKLLGVVYMGKDISAHYMMVKRIFFILTGISLVFFVFAAVAAYFMAGHAMIPIKKSFLRQKEFVADASHELRTPLSVLLASIDVIEGDEENHMTAFSHQVFEDMKDETRKMSKIVGDLLTLARADAGAVQLRKENYAFLPEAQRIMRNLQPLANEKEISLIMDSAEQLPIYADRERLNQLLIILLDNAIKYTPKGGEVALRMETVKQERDSKLVLSIFDTGVGIAPGDQERIFERFYRVDKVRSRAMGGTGLGLAIADWIVKEHGGTINVSSKPGKGTTFTITIPM